MSGKSRFDLYVPLFHAQIDKTQKKNVIIIVISIAHEVFEYSGINVLLQLFRNEILELLEHLGNHRDLVLLLYFLASLAETQRFRDTLYSPRLLFLPLFLSLTCNTPTQKSSRSRERHYLSRRSFLRLR